MKMIVVKCVKCTEKMKRNILFEQKPMGIDFLQLDGEMIEGKCPICGFKIIIATN